MTEDLTIAGTTLLIEKYQKEIWEWKQKESQWISDKNLLEGIKRIVEELSQKIVDMGKKVREAEGETSIVEDDNYPKCKVFFDGIESGDDTQIEIQGDTANE